jgi:hypothetical protein
LAHALLRLITLLLLLLLLQWLLWLTHNKLLLLLLALLLPLLVIQQPARLRVPLPPVSHPAVYYQYGNTEIRQCHPL